VAYTSFLLRFLLPRRCLHTPWYEFLQLWFPDDRHPGIRYDVSVPRPGDVDVRIRIIIVAGEVGAIEIAKEKKYRPRTKHLNCRLHHFWYYVQVTRKISVHKIDTKCQPADMLTKPLREEDFVRHRKSVMGWWYDVVWSDVWVTYEWWGSIAWTHLAWSGLLFLRFLVLFFFFSFCCSE